VFAYCRLICSEFCHGCGVSYVYAIVSRGDTLLPALMICFEQCFDEVEFGRLYLTIIEHPIAAMHDFSGLLRDMDGGEYSENLYLRRASSLAGYPWCVNKMSMSIKAYSRSSRIDMIVCCTVIRTYMNCRRSLRFRRCFSFLPAEEHSIL
jgi:hypothetical protein